MASSNFFFFFFFILFAHIISTAKASNFTKNAIHLKFYFHATLAGPGQTTFTVAGLNRSTPFGNIFVYDGPLTQGSDLNSTEIGRAQGADAVAAMDGSLLTLTNYLFTAGPYNGSYITLTGRADVTTETADRTIVGGGGQFRMARGYSLAAVYFANATYQVVVNDFYVQKFSD